jgi:hypothetical protein
VSWQSDLRHSEADDWISGATLCRRQAATKLGIARQRTGNNLGRRESEIRGKGPRNESTGQAVEGVWLDGRVRQVLRTARRNKRSSVQGADATAGRERHKSAGANCRGGGG